MQWVKGTGEDKSARVLLLDNHEACARALARLLRWGWNLPVREMLSISPGDTLEAILQELKSHSRPDDVLYLDAQLTYAECPDPAEFGGIRLVMHIRFSDSPEPPTLLPIVIGSVEPPEHFIRQAPDLIFAFSPGCALVWLQGRLSDLEKALRDTHSFRDLTQMRQAVRPFVVFTDADERQRVHAYLNRAGVGRFLEEFVPRGVLPPGDRLLEDYRRMRSRELWLAKMEWLRPLEGGEPSVGPSDEEWRNFIRNTSSSRFILIDDEYRFGWSLGLYAGLTGFLPSSEADSSKKLLCFDSFSEAWQFLEEQYEKFRRLLEKWAMAEGQEVEKTREYREAHRQRDEARNHRDSACRSFERVRSDCERIKQGYQRAWEALRASWQNAGEYIADLYTRNADIFEHYGRLSTVLQEFWNNWMSFGGLQRQLEQAEADLRKAEEAREQAERKFAEADERLRRVDRALQEAREQRQRLDSQLQEAFLYDLIFLDLRLERQDEDTAVGEISGMRLLRKLKQEWFPWVPILVITASEKALTYATARKIGADGYWIKGVQSGGRLRQEIRNCMEKSRLKKYWIQLEKLKCKQEVHCYAWQHGGLQLRVLDRENSDRGLIVRLLEEALRLFQEALSQEDPPRAGGPWNSIILYLGVLQEIRYRGLFDVDKWWEKIRLTQVDEKELRDQRNVVAHQGAACSRETAERFLGFSLDWLLRPKVEGAP